MTAELAPTADQLAESILSGFEALRQTLIHRPAALSLDTCGTTLSRLQADLATLAQLPGPVPSRELLRDIQIRSSQVDALFRSAATFFAGLTEESVKNSHSFGAAYSADGEYTSPQSSRVATEA
jgi:hypothetical protein